MPFLTEITCDLYDIASRLREIDDNYRVYYNGKEKRFEVHNLGQKGSTFCLTVPYSRLDVRTLDLVRQTRRENADRLFAEMEKQNAELERQERQKIIENNVMGCDL